MSKTEKICATALLLFELCLIVVLALAAFPAIRAELSAVHVPEQCWWYLGYTAGVVYLLASWLWIAPAYTRWKWREFKATAFEWQHSTLWYEGIPFEVLIAFAPLWPLFVAVQWAIPAANRFIYGEE